MNHQGLAWSELSQVLHRDATGEAHRRTLKGIFLKKPTGPEQTSLHWQKNHFMNMCTGQRMFKKKQGSSGLIYWDHNVIRKCQKLYLDLFDAPQKAWQHPNHMEITKLGPTMMRLRYKTGNRWLPCGWFRAPRSFKPPPWAQIKRPPGNGTLSARPGYELWGWCQSHQSYLPWAPDRRRPAWVYQGSPTFEDSPPWLPATTLSALPVVGFWYVSCSFCFCDQ